MLAKWGSGEGGEGALGSRGEGEREGWEEANGRIFQVPRAKKLEQETGKGLPSNPNAVMVVVMVVCTLKLMATLWCVGCLLFGDPF